MKYYIFAIVIFIAFSCGNKSIKTPTTEENDGSVLISNEVKALNDRIRSLGGKLTSQNVIKMYYPNEVIDSDEGSETITITTDGSKITTTEVTLIHDKMLNDIIQGEKHVLVMEPNKESWKVLYITKTWKCWRDGPDATWGTKACH